MKKEIIKRVTDKFNNLLYISYNNFSTVINNTINEKNNQIYNLFNQKLNELQQYNN